MKIEDIKGIIEKYEEIKNILKGEFFGIDKQIEDTVESFKNWELSYEIQSRPYVINLWGQTGVGKTSLIHRIIELGGFKKNVQLYNALELYHDRGDISLSNIFDSFESDGYNHQDYPAILVFDEFHHFKDFRKQGDQFSTNNSNSSTYWTLIDSGIVPIGINSRYSFIVEKLYKVLTIYKSDIISTSMGDEMDIVCKFKYSKGLESNLQMYRGSGIYLKEVLDEQYITVSLSMYDVHKELFGYSNYENIKDIANTPLEKLFYDYLEVKYLKMSTTTSIDFSKALIINIGNIDSLYRMSDVIDAEHDADLLYNLSNNISIFHLKQELKELFRLEHISRLGNNHIIYPSLSKRAYERIIDSKLQDHSTQFKNYIDWDITFSKAIKKFIYLEGVLPAQGVRPLLTTINGVILSISPKIVSEVVKDEEVLSKAKTMHYDYKGGKVVVRILDSDKKTLFKKSLEVNKIVEPLKVVEQNDNQAIVAVHESGHFLASYLVKGTLPNGVHSSTSDGDTGGFVIDYDLENPINFITSDYVVSELAIMLAGRYCEGLIFGNDNITSGASSDIKSATQFAISAYADWCLQPTKYSNQNIEKNYITSSLEESQSHSKRIIEDVDSVAKEFIKEAMDRLSNMFNDESVYKAFMQSVELLYKKPSLTIADMKKVVSLLNEEVKETFKMKLGFKDKLENKIKNNGTIKG